MAAFRSSVTDEVQSHGEGAALARRAFHLNGAGVLFDHGIAKRKAQSCSRFSGGAREERIEDIIGACCRDAVSGIGHLDGDFMKFHSDVHAEPAPVWHRVDGVQKQVHEYRLEQMGVAEDERGNLRELRAHFNVMDLGLFGDQFQCFLQDGDQVHSGEIVPGGWACEFSGGAQ